MSNPYAPPSAAIGEGPEAPPPPLAVRILRGVAVAGNAFLGLLPLFPLFASRAPQAGLLVFAAFTFLLGGTSIMALVPQTAGRIVFWSALFLNGAAALLFIYVFHLRAQPSDWQALLIFTVPILLNIAAIWALRRSRARPASGQ